MPWSAPSNFTPGKLRQDIDASNQEVQLTVWRTWLVSSLPFLFLAVGLSACSGGASTPQLDSRSGSPSATATSDTEVASQTSEAGVVSGPETSPQSAQPDAASNATAGSAPPQAAANVEGAAEPQPPQGAGLGSQDAGAPSTQAARSTDAKQGPIAPDFTVTTAFDSSFSLREHVGDVIVLYFSFVG